MRTDFSHEFVVDEKPAPLAERGDGEAESDLMSLAARAMLENERLQDLAKTLAESAQTDQQTLRMIRALLPVLDSFELVCQYARGMEMSEELANWLRSVEGIEARLLQTLERQGLERVDPMGQQVDLNRDEVVEYRPTDDHPGDTVIEVRRKGFKFRGKALRDAQVIIANNTRREA